MIEIAKKYHKLGLSIIPIGVDKVPIGAWKQNQSTLIAPNKTFETSYGIGLVCGKVSGGVEVLDIDCKYDLTDNLFKELKELINNTDKKILPKLVVQKSVNGGYHFFYKCLKIEGNLKLAHRETTEQERELTRVNTYERELKKTGTDEAKKVSDKSKVNDKVRVLIETRGEGGYVALFPTKGYEVLYGTFDKINEITETERQIIFDCAKSFNQVFAKPYIKKEQQAIISNNVSPFDEWNERGDVLDLLMSEGWRLHHTTGARNFLLRPGGTGKWSAEYHTEKKLFYVWTKSTEFDDEKAYNPSQVLCTIKFNKDYSNCAKWLLSQGFGSFTPDKKNKEFKPEIEYKVSLDDDDYSFLATDEEVNLYITQKRNGTFKMGNGTGFPELDKYYRFKDAQLDMILGHDNAGKSVVSWYFSVLDCVFNDQKYLIFAGENKTGAVKSRIIEFYTGKAITVLAESELKMADVWFRSHYDLVRNDEIFNYADMINIGKKMLKKKKYTKFIIEPYNVLDKKTGNEHQYDYRAMIDFRMFIRQTGVGLLLNVHAATEALRRTYPKEHEWWGYTMPPNKADTEGGGKFPNKADNFIVVHRMADHETEWMWTEIHIQKIKENETGGQRTLKNKPFKMRLTNGGYGFEDEKEYNPIANYWSKKGQQIGMKLTENKEFLNEPKETQRISQPKKEYDLEGNEIIPII